MFSCGLALVRRGFDDETIQVDRIGDAAKFFEAPVAAAPATLELSEEARQAGRADAEELDVHLGDAGEVGHGDGREAVNRGGFVNGELRALLTGVEAGRTTRTVIGIFMVLVAGLMSGCSTPPNSTLIVDASTVDAAAPMVMSVPASNRYQWKCVCVP